MRDTDHADPPDTPTGDFRTPNIPIRSPAADYLKAGETFLSSGYGGSESLTFSLQCSQRGHIVRKVLASRLITPVWDREGADVMLPPHAKARRQAEWLQALPPDVAPLFPTVLDMRCPPSESHAPHGRHADEFLYDMTFVPGIEISRFIREYKPKPSTVALLYAEIFSLLRRKVHSHRRAAQNGDTLESSYFSKIEKRLRLSQVTAPITFSGLLLEPDSIRINGRYMRNLPQIMRILRSNPVFRRVLEPKFHCLVVGDTNTENIKIGNIGPLLELDKGTKPRFDNPPFTAEDLDIRFLDPRAIGFHVNGIDTGADDPMYDNKPWHNSLGNYDVIHGGYFDIHFCDTCDPVAIDIEHRSNRYSAAYKDIGDYFLPAMSRAWGIGEPGSLMQRDDPYWIIRFVFIMGTHFMSMPPFHFDREPDGSFNDTPTHQKRPLAIYAEGIKWLNLAIDMLEGKVREFHGVRVPYIDPRSMGIGYAARCAASR